MGILITGANRRYELLRITSRLKAPGSTRDREIAFESLRRYETYYYHVVYPRRFRTSGPVDFQTRSPIEWPRRGSPLGRILPHFIGTITYYKIRFARFRTLCSRCLYNFVSYLFWRFFFREYSVRNGMIVSRIFTIDKRRRPDGNNATNRSRGFFFGGGGLPAFFTNFEISSSKPSAGREYNTLQMSP